MGVAILRVHNHVLTELLGFRGIAEVAQVLPPGAFELERQTCLIIVEAQEFPVTPPGMRIPEIWAVYEMHQGGPVFKGFEMVNEPKEFPAKFVNIPPAPGSPEPPASINSLPNQPPRSPAVDGGDSGDYGVYNNEDEPPPLVGA